MPWKDFPARVCRSNLELPKQVFGHPWLLIGDGKMSKSKGNVMYADDLVNLFGLDEIRYYLLHEIPFANDGTITYDLIIERINSDLANILGNLVNRTISMVNKYFDGVVPSSKYREQIDDELISLALKTPEIVTEHMDELKVAAAIDDIFELLRRCNKYIDETTPWILAKDETKKDRLGTVLYNLLESIRIASVLLSAFLPDTSKEIFNQLNTTLTNYESLSEFNGMEQTERVNQPKPLFARIDKNIKLKELEDYKSVK